jgi:HAMP domain-containing protein
MKIISIRVRLTLWYAALVAGIVTVLGIGVFYGASSGLRKAADQELTSGIDGIETFLHHKLAIHEMNNLGEELREHSALLPRGKMFRVTDSSGSVVYQPDAMAVVTSIPPGPHEIRKGNIFGSSRSFRAISRFATVGPYTFLLQVAFDQTEYEKLMSGLRWLLILSIPVAGLLSVGAGYWMSGRVLAPIEHITQTTNSIDASSLKLRLPLRGTDDELDQLSSMINHMLDRKGRIEIMTKPGTPQVHGTLNLTFRDSVFDAKNHFAESKSFEQKRIYEGSITGPLGFDR